jgi:hypothetical protein
MAETRRGPPRCGGGPRLWTTVPGRAGCRRYGVDRDGTYVDPYQPAAWYSLP